MIRKWANTPTFFGSVPNMFFACVARIGSAKRSVCALAHIGDQAANAPTSKLNAEPEKSQFGDTGG
jgi:hypothetical protein